MPKRSKAVKEMDIELSKNGIPCIWEQGEGKRHTGEAVVICNSNGGRKKALFVNRKKGLSCREHALIPTKVFDGNLDYSWDWQGF